MVAWWAVGYLVVFTMGLLGIWWVLFFAFFFFLGGGVVWFQWDFDGQWWRGGSDWVVCFFNKFARFLAGICWVLFFLI